MDVDLRSVAGSEILAGGPNGRIVFGRLVALVGTSAETEPIYMDFRDVFVVTGSFARECILAFRNFIRKSQSNYYPVICNANDTVAEELDEWFRERGDAILACDRDACGTPSNVRVIGILDQKQKITFELVQKHRKIDAAGLMRMYGEEEGIKQTAWNNRLSSLSSLGLISESSVGRAKVYAPVL